MIPDRIPSNRSDNLIGAFDQLGEMMIQMQLEFDHALDADRLARAVDLTLDAEPVLGCRYVNGFFQGHWRRLDPGERDCFTVAKTQSEFEQFKRAPINNDNGAQLRACLLPTADGDRLLFKISHLAGDSAGLKEAVARVADTYGQLRDNPEFRPTPNTDFSRGLWQIFRQLPLSAWPQILKNAWQESRRKSKPRPSHAFCVLDETGKAVRTEEPAFLVRHLTPVQVSGMVELGERCGGKINDVVGAIFLRALANEGDKQPGTQLRLQSTVDLRRWYLPEQTTVDICNLSYFEYLNLGEDPGPNLQTTLERVSQFSRDRKQNWIGLSSFLGEIGLLLVLPSMPLNAIFGQISHLRNARNLLTNMGPIDTDRVTFDHPPQYAFMLVPPLYAPAVGFGVSGFDGRLTISTAVPEQFVATTDSFLDEIVAELDKGIREELSDSRASSLSVNDSSS